VQFCPCYIEVRGQLQTVPRLISHKCDGDLWIPDYEPVSRLLICNVILYFSVYCMILQYDSLHQPFSIFLPWRNPWNNFQVSGNPCIKIIISTAHGTLAWSVSCRYSNPIIIVNALLSRECYFSVDLFILARLKKMLIFSITISRGTPLKKPWSTLFLIVIPYCNLNIVRDKKKK
jgi:hypothetical protein